MTSYRFFFLFNKIFPQVFLCQAGFWGVCLFFPEDKRARNKKQIFYRQESGAICNRFPLNLQSFLEAPVSEAAPGCRGRENASFSFSIH
jgi:hypothetical protein